MADFSANATQLEAPQGAGANPIAPVTQEVTPANWGQALAGVGQEIGNLAGNYAKKQNLDAENAFLGQLAQKQAVINQGVTQGAIGTSEADARSRAAFNSALAARPDLYQKIGGIFNVFKDTTVEGDVVTARQDAQKQKAADISAASTAGYYIPGNASDDTKDAIVRAHKAGVQMRQQLEDTYKANAEKRSQGTFDAAVAERENETNIVQNVNLLTGQNLNAAYGQIQDIAKGPGTPQEKALAINQAFSQYEGTINAIGANKPQLVAGSQALFANMKKAALDFIDPSKSSADSTAQLTNILNQAKLAGLADPKNRAVVATSQMLGNAPGVLEILKAQSGKGIVDAIVEKSQTPVTNGQAASYTTPVVGNPDVEAGTLKFLKSSINGIQGGAFPDPVKAKVETANTVNGVMAEVGDAISKARPQDLKGLANFFASPEYASWIKNGPVDPIAQQNALRTFQKVYMPEVTNQIGTRLQGNLIPASEDGTQTAVSLAQGLDVKSQNGVLTFVPKAGLKLSADQAQVEQTTIRNLNEVQTALNTMVHLGAHMQGSTDYEKHWEENKYYYLPQVYPVRPGQVVGNLKWSGDGDWRDKSTWSRVGQR